MTRIVDIATLFALPLSLILIAAPSRAASPDEIEFLTKAASAGAAEVEISRLAETRASDPAVQEFARHMVTDHSRINKELGALAKRKQVTVDPKPNEAQRKDYRDLKAKSIEDFDQAYVDQMLSDHKAAVALFEGGTRNAGDREISAFSSKTLKTLRHHSKMAQRLNKGQPIEPHARGPKS